MTQPVDDIDPTTATNWDELATRLRWLRARADNISYRELERWGEEHKKPLPRTTLLEVLHGRRFPRKSLLLAFVEACGVDPVTDTRWERTWNKLNEQLNLADSSVPTVPLAAEDRSAGFPASGHSSRRAEDDRTPDFSMPPEVWDQAQELIQQARFSAEQIVSNAREEAVVIVERAYAEATAIGAAAELQAERTIRDADERAEQIVRDADQKAKELWDSVVRELVVKVDESEQQGLAAPRQVEGATAWEQPPAESAPGRSRWRFGR